MTKRKPPHLHKPSGRRPWRTFTDDEVRRMTDLWQAGRSQTHIAAEFDTSQSVVSRVLHAAGVPKPLERRTGNKRGADHNWWKGGVIGADGGYVWVSYPTDGPLAVMRNRMGYVPQHRLVMAQSLGRPLASHETVHHINGIRDDNRLENLQLRQGRHGKGARYVCADCGSHNVIPASLAEGD